MRSCCTVYLLSILVAANTKPVARRDLSKLSANFLRLIFGLVLAVTVSACTGDTIGTGTKFSQTSSKEALVIMGVRSNKWYGWDYSINWSPFDHATGQYGADGRRPINVARSAFEIYSGKGLSETKYLIFKAQPGAYLLRSSTVTGRRVAFTSIYRPGTVAIDVSAGQILYVGDFIFIVPERGYFNSPHGTRLRNAGRSDKGAKQALAEYSNINGQMVFVKPTPIKTP